MCFMILLFEGPFVAAFASSNLGDVSPNLSGAFCLDPDQVSATN